MTNLVKQSLA